MIRCFTLASIVFLTACGSAGSDDDSALAGLESSPGAPAPAEPAPAPAAQDASGDPAAPATPAAPAPSVTSGGADAPVEPAPGFAPGEPHPSAPPPPTSPPGVPNEPSRGHDCDTSKIVCQTFAPVVCPDGQVPTVVNGCYGECVPKDRCAPPADEGVVCAAFIEISDGVCSRRDDDPCRSQDPDCQLP